MDLDYEILESGRELVEEFYRDHPGLRKDLCTIYTILSDEFGFVCCEGELIRMGRVILRSV